MLRNTWGYLLPLMLATHPVNAADFGLGGIFWNQVSF